MSAVVTPQQPLIWLLLGDKQGDNAQVQVVADALGLPTVLRRVIPRAEFVLGKPRVRAALDHLDPQKSDTLEPPWPDLILTIGRRPSMAALWVQEQSGGHSRIVLFGPPKRWPERFALVIAPAQYRLAGNTQVLPIRFPLMRSDESAIVAARAQWQARLQAMGAPLTALLIGGQTKPYRLDAAYAHSLVNRALELAAPGALYVSTSRRTPPAAVEAVRAALPPQAGFFCWPGEPRDNPYLGLLACADRFIVTGDSISMMIEVARRGRPLAIAELPFRGRVATVVHNWLKPRTGDLLQRAGVLRGARDLAGMHQVLYAEGLACALTEGFSPGGKGLEDELPRVTAAIRALVQL